MPHRRGAEDTEATQRANVSLCAIPFYEVINEAEMPVIFHSGHSGIGTGQRGGGGVRLKYGNPMDIDDVASSVRRIRKALFPGG
jgi:predicted TIM-barrel fold metal-dependent hydrolase